MTSEFNPISTNRVLLLAVLLTLIAAIPRLYDLGNLGFYMDEETTAFASRTMIETGTPQMPSGMPYYRGLTFTWLNSISAKIFGLNAEFSYRLPSALFGIFTVPLLFLLARPYVGTSVAFLAALLLALSEWHIITSRQARMYAPFLFFYVAFAFSILRWAKNDTFKHLAISTALFIATVSFHELGIFAALIPLITLFVKGYSTTPQYKLILFSVISGFAAYFYSQFVVYPYQAWKDAHSIMTAANAPNAAFGSFLSSNALLIAQGIPGFLLGIWLGIRLKFQDSENGRELRIFARYILAILFGAFAVTGHLHGAFLAILLLLLLYPGSLFDFLRQAYKPVVIITLLAIIVSLLTISKSGIIPGMKLLLTFPYPNWIELNNISTGITLLFIFSMLYLAFTKKGSGNRNVLNLLIIGLYPLIIVGIFKKWAPARYLLEAYPFMLILSAYVLQTLPIKFIRRFYITQESTIIILLAYAIGLSGILGGHGLMQAYRAGTIEYGDRINKAALIFPFYPDHKSPGEFVAANRRPGDVVVAEDALTQRWYAGEIDYWLRHYINDRAYLYEGDDHQLHDIYLNSIAVTPDILKSLTSDKDRRIWIITSGETYYERDYYLTEQQRYWLETIEKSRTPDFIGKDNITKVYCLNCND